MKTNKEKALNLIEEVKYNPNWWNNVVEAIELASTPDKFYPIKGELPKINGWINTSYGFPMFTMIGWDYAECQTTGKKYKFSEMSSWNYLQSLKE